MPECPACNTRSVFGAACCTTCGASLPRTNPAPKNTPIYGEKKLIVVNLESVVDMSPAHRIARRQKKKGRAAKKVLRDYMNTFKARPNAKDFLSRLSQRQGALVAFVSDFPESDKSKVADMLRSLALPLSHDDSGVLVFMGSDKAALNRYSSTYTITHYFGPGFRDARKMMVPAAYSSVEDYIGAPANPYLAPPASPGPYTLSGLRPEPTPGPYTLTNPTGKKNCGCGQDPCITYGPLPNSTLDSTRRRIESEEAAGSKIEQLKKENEEILARLEELDMEIEKAQFEGKSTVDLQLHKGELAVSHEENLTDISKLQKAMKLSQSTRPEYLRANRPVDPMSVIAGVSLTGVAGWVGNKVLEAIQRRRDIKIRRQEMSAQTEELKGEMTQLRQVVDEIIVSMDTPEGPVSVDLSIPAQVEGTVPAAHSMVAALENDMVEITAFESPLEADRVVELTLDEEEQDWDVVMDDVQEENKEDYFRGMSEWEYWDNPHLMTYDDLGDLYYHPEKDAWFSTSDGYDRVPLLRGYSGEPTVEAMNLINERLKSRSLVNPPVKPRRQTNKKTGKKRKESAKNYFQRLVSNKKMNEEFPRNDQRVKVALSYVEKEYGKRGVDSVTKTWGTRRNPAMSCPLATQDLKVNTRNRDAAIDAEHIQYGPLNLSDAAYWLRYSEKWGTTPEVAKKSNCSICVAFDISPRMKDCMPGKTSDDEGELGYCWMHHFKCHSARTCYTWAAGGPIVSDETSHDWQRKNQPMKNAPFFRRRKESNLFTDSRGTKFGQDERQNNLRIAGRKVNMIRTGQGVFTFYYRGGPAEWVEYRGERYSNVASVVLEPAGDGYELSVNYANPRAKKNAPFDAEVEVPKQMRALREIFDQRLTEACKEYIDEELMHLMMFEARRARTEDAEFEVLLEDPAAVKAFMEVFDFGLNKAGLRWQEIMRRMSEMYPPSTWVNIRIEGDGRGADGLPDPVSSISFTFLYPREFIGKMRDEGKKRNPRAKKNPPSQKKMDKAKKAYKDFNGKDPKEVRTEKVDFGGMLVYLGDCWSIGYRNGKEGFGDDQKYIHEFGVDEETGRTFEEPKLYMTVPDKGKPMLVIKDGAWKIKTDKNGVSWIYY